MRKPRYLPRSAPAKGLRRFPAPWTRGNEGARVTSTMAVGLGLLETARAHEPAVTRTRTWARCRVRGRAPGCASSIVHFGRVDQQ